MKLKKFIYNIYLKKKIKNLNSKKIIKIWSRNSIITKDFLDLKCAIYNGKIFKKILIKKEMLGYKFGEFCLTRTFHKIKKKNKK